MFDFTVLGTSSATPAFGRHLSAFIIQYNHRLFLLDCGEGTQFQFNRYKISHRRLEAIFISHLHGDHILGLPGLLSSMSLSGRSKLLTLIGPKGIKDFIKIFCKLTQTFLTFKLTIIEIEKIGTEIDIHSSEFISEIDFESDSGAFYSGEVLLNSNTHNEIISEFVKDKKDDLKDKKDDLVLIPETNIDKETLRKVLYSRLGIEVSCFPLEHRIPCFGYFFREVDKKRKFLVQNAYELNIPSDYFHLIKKNIPVELPDGRIIDPESCLGNFPELFSFAYCSDTCFFEKLPVYIKNVYLLYHEATFLEENEKQAKASAHSTAKEAALIAKEADAQCMIIGHFSARYKDLQKFLDEARTIFPKTYLSVEGKTYLIPYHEERIF